jgi:hypothetical protein
MAKRTRSQIEAELAALQSELDGADTDDEVWVKGPDGHEVKVTGRRATNVLSRFGSLFDAPDEGGAAGGDGADEDEDEDEKDPEPGGAGYFKRRR